MQYGQTLTAEWPLLARIRARQMYILFFDPVVHDWQHSQTKALVIGGAQGNYAEFSRSCAQCA